MGRVLVNNSSVTKVREEYNIKSRYRITISAFVIHDLVGSEVVEITLDQDDGSTLVTGTGG